MTREEFLQLLRDYKQENQDYYIIQTIGGKYEKPERWYMPSELESQIMAEHDKLVEAILSKIWDDNERCRFCGAEFSSNHKETCIVEYLTK